MEELLLKIKNRILREITGKLKLRPDSDPYITGDSFRKMADHIYDETSKCDPKNIQEGQLVFVKSDLIPEWFRDIHPKIASKYKLITHNSDYNIRESDLSFIDDKIIKWFAQNVLVKHPKLIPIPCGINNYYWYNFSQPGFYNRYKKLPSGAQNRIIFGFSISTNPAERQIAYDYLIKSPIADKIRGRNYPRTYTELIRKYKFIACPNGNGLDDPRRWQAFYFGLIPIVTKSEAMIYFKNLGLPIWIIENWNELDEVTESDLAKKYDEMMGKMNKSPIYLDYWKKIVTEK